MEHISKLASHALQNESQRPVGTPCAPLMSEKLLVALWVKMGHLYGHRWTATFGESAMFNGDLSDVARTWASGLAGVTGEQIAVGLKACSESADGWPPTLPEFRAACLGKKNEAGGDKHYCPTFNGPVHERVTDRSRLLSNEDRDTRRAKLRDGFARIIEALKGRG